VEITTCRAVPGETIIAVLSVHLCTQKSGYDQLLSILRGQGHFGMAARRRNAPNDIGRPLNNLLRLSFGPEDFLAAKTVDSHFF